MQYRIYGTMRFFGLLRRALALVGIGFLFLFAGGPANVPVGGIAPAQAGELTPVRVGALKFGTVNWELDVIQHHGLAKKEGVDLKVVPLASKNAAAVALQGGAVDMIVTDWIWVSRQRAAGFDYTFVPYATVAGGVMVRPDSGIRTVADLRGKRIGVAGGPVDKSWLLLRAYTRKTLGVDLADAATPVYGAPPLLNKLIQKGEFPAVLTYWHYQARLKVAGLTQVIAISDLLHGLGIGAEMPVIGWVFSEKWAAKNMAAVKGFLKASRAAKKILAESDAEWERLMPLTKAKNAETLVALREGYREGIPKGFGQKEIDASRTAFALLAKLGGTDLVGASRELSPGTFWTAAMY